MDEIGIMFDNQTGIGYDLELSGPTRKKTHMLFARYNDQYVGYVSFFDMSDDLIMKSIHLSDNYRRNHGSGEVSVRRFVIQHTIDGGHPWNIP